LSWDVLLQRLFSAFPDGSPGVGLLFFRLCLSVALIYFGAPGLTNPSDPIPFARALIAAAGAIFLLVGLWTPVLATLIALAEVWSGSSLYSQSRDNMWIHIFLAILCISLAMLGPGVWSIDARLFGRKRFDIDRARGKRPSP
jgi:putative oxidoreductase